MAKKIKVGETFEKAVEQICRYLFYKYPNCRIEHNVMIDGPYGPRQIDVLITITTPICALKIVIECKDVNKRLDITYIDAFQSKLEELNASKGIMIARKGFSKQAKVKAKDNNFSLYSLLDAVVVENLHIAVPFLIEEIIPLKIDINFDVTHAERANAPKEIYFGKQLTINEQDAVKLLEEEWKGEKLPFDLSKGRQIIDIPGINPPYYLRYFTDRQKRGSNVMEIENVKGVFDLKTRCFVADVTELMHHKVLQNADENRLVFFIDTSTLKGTLETLKPVSAEFAQNFKGIQYKIKLKTNVEMKFNSFRRLTDKTEHDTAQKT